MFDILKEILISETDLTKTDHERLTKHSCIYKKNFIDSDGNMYLTVDSLIEISNITTGSNNITLRKVNAKSYGLDKIYMDKDLIEDKLYQIIDQFNERKITPLKFYSILLNEMHPFYDGNGRTCEILFANDDKIK